MIIKRKISYKIQVALFAFALLYLFSALLRFYSEDNFGGAYKSNEKKSLVTPIGAEKQLILTSAASVNASSSGIISEKEPFILPVLFFLGLIFIYHVRRYLLFPAPVLSCRTLQLFKVLPNAP